MEHRVVLCFGAVHHRARVLVDGHEIGSHVGGYEPFEFDITAHAAPGATVTLIVDVFAPADKRPIPHGKQRSIPRDDYDGVSFTPTSGIWQSVWLEARGRTYADVVKVRGETLTGFDLEGQLVGDTPADAAVFVTVSDGSPHGETVELTADPSGRFRGRLALREPRPWSPADPHLYRLTVTTPGDVADEVVLTCGLRRIEVAGEQLRLNGERLYVRGVLDQGYWPGSGATAPDDAALVADLELVRDYGYNLVRKHIKLEEPRWLHHADRMGVLVWAEPPAPSRYSPEAAAAFENQLPGMVDRDGNHPCIVIWGLYNEEWGLDWDIPGSPARAAAAAHAYDVLRAHDDTRPVVENSGWAHVRTDLVDWHYYDEDPQAWADNLASLADGSRETFPVRLGPDYVVHKTLYGDDAHPRAGRPLLNSEYGAGFTSLERAWHLRWQTQELRRHDRFAGYVYTELADIEHEMAGLLDAHRCPKDLGGLRPQDVNCDTVVVVDLVPATAGADIPIPDGDLAITLHVSHHGSRPLEGRVGAAWVPAGTPFGHALPPSISATEPFKIEPFVLSPAVRLTVPSPGAVPACRLQLWLLDEVDDVRARTYVDAAPIEPPNRPAGR
jgi:beta-galactosidase/beta-glucuronidase